MNNEAELAEILDQCLEQVRRGAAPAAVLREHPEEAEQLRPLLALAGDLESFPDPQYSLTGVMKTMMKTADQFRREQAAAAVRWYSLWRAPLLSRVATVALVVLVLWWGAGTASTNAVPGEWLYPVKLLTERVKFFLTINAEDKAELRIVFSEERLTEAVKKIERGEGFDRRLLDEMLDEAKQAVQASATLPEFSRKLLVSRAAHASEFQRDALNRVKDSVPPPQRETVIRYMDMCGNRADWMRQMPAQESQRGHEQPKREWRSWMDMCPMGDD